MCCYPRHQLYMGVLRKYMFEWMCFLFFFQAEDGIRDLTVTGVQTCALPICPAPVDGGLGPVPGGTAINVRVLGAGGVPASGVAAVVLNVTVTGPTSEGFLTVYPAGLQQVPLASNLNFLAGQTVPNRVIAKVGANGAISIYNGSGLAHVVVDVNGWFSDDTNWQLTGSGFKATLLPTRILDTRVGTSDYGSPIGAMGPDTTMSLPVAGRGGVPGMTAQRPPTAVVLNVTVTNPTAGDHLTIWPGRSEEHTSELQSQSNIVCRLLLEKKNEQTLRIINVPARFVIPQSLLRQIVVPQYRTQAPAECQHGLRSLRLDIIGKIDD